VQRLWPVLVVVRPVGGDLMYKFTCGFVTDDPVLAVRHTFQCLGVLMDEEVA
jgi:hypothetical protein